MDRGPRLPDGTYACDIMLNRHIAEMQRRRDNPVIIRRKLSLERVNVNWAACAASFSDLEEIEIKHLAEDMTPSIQELKTLLSVSPNLVCLAIHGYIPREQESEIELLNLTDLTISCWDSDLQHATRFSLLLYCPSLKNLTLKVEAQDTNSMTSPIAALSPRDIIQSTIRQSRRHRPSIPLSALHSLTLDGIRVSSTRFMVLITECTSLQRLDLRHIGHDTALELVRVYSDQLPVFVNGEDGRNLVRLQDALDRLIDLEEELEEEEEHKRKRRRRR